MDNTAIVSVQEQKQLQLLNNGLITADRFINKNYLINISEQNIVPLNEYEKTTNSIRLFQIIKLVYDKTENINDKLISVYSALQNVDSSALLVINGNGKEVTFYIGIRSVDNAATASKILEKSFVGNFPGSTLRSMKNGEIAEVMETVAKTENYNTSRNVSCVTVIPSMRDADKDKFVQGIEKFIDTMQGEKFTAVFIAKPVPKDDLEMRKRGFEELYSSLSPFIKTSLAYGENYSKAVTSGMFENFSHSVNNSISNTTGKNSSTSSSRTHGTNSGSSIGGGGFSINSGTTNSTTSGYSSGSSWSKSVTEGTADTTGSGTNQSDTETRGNTRTLTVEHQNKSVSVLLDKIDEQLERIKACEAFGVWECAGYFIADDIQTSVVAANTYKALDNKLDDIKDAAYEGRDAEGNMTPEAKEKLVDDMKQAYDNTPKEDRGDTLVPEKSEYLKNPSIAENKNTGERYNDVNYDWPSNGGFEGKPEEVTPQVGDRFDRVGAENGRYVAPIEGDTPQPVENRGLPYHFTEDNITDEPSYHSYEVDRDFGQLQDAINEYNNPALTAEENEFMRGEFQKEYDRNNWPSDEYTHEPGKTYYGDIAEAFDSGGGTQLELPMSVESLKELGMIHEV